MRNYNIPQLPLPHDLETKEVLKQLNNPHNAGITERIFNTIFHILVQFE